ncbi:uncharacterized protein LOC122380196 isoform X2 [Amphibalanus amphitrite]|uniref:uncharacterized protein LOC122380196 isoform X2 n=1 Tax=Amphibalanus amphitrite TaxID=1232801 RepID=UPI001C8FF3D4|nr:uncharacterized protein LOC122380196 isoform X2 [Amphibalanus amphitrite]
MNLITLCYAAGILAQVSTADDPSAVLEGISADASSRGSPDQKRDSEVTVLRQGVPAGPLLLVGPAGDPAGGVQLVQDSLEPLLLPPVVDVFPDVPDRVGDTPLQVQTVIEAEPADDDEPLDVPWVWDDKVCSPLLNRAPPPAGPLTTEQVTFALPLVVRERNRLKLKTRSGAVSPLHSDEAASTFEKLFWCITALIARVREPEERTRLMKKLYQDYLLWMERDVIPVFNRTDLRRAYKWIKRKDDSQWVVPEKKYYDSANKKSPHAERQTAGDDKGGDGNKTGLIIFILILIIVIIIILYCCIVKKKKLFNLWCFCVCERCRKGQGGKNHEEERRPLAANKNGSPGGLDGPKNTYVYRSSSWSSNSSLQPPCPPPDPCDPPRPSSPCP